MIGVKYIVGSSNRKLSSTGNVDTTYASIESSCPKSCSFKDNGCYASLGPTGIHVKRLDKESVGVNATIIARNEAKAIDESYNRGEVSNPYLRLHTSGDSRTVKGSSLINSAIGRWLKRGGKKAWSYTHAWQSVKRSVWSNISMLASVENIKDINKARKMGYAPSIVVSHFESDKVFSVGGTNTKFIPCPAQTRDRTCDQCRLCFDDRKLFEMNKGIAFAAHGIKKNSMKKHLKII